MNGQSSGTLIGLVVTAFFLTFAVWRRMRPQPVRPQRLLVFSAFIVVAVGLSFVGSGAQLIHDPVAIVLAPVCLLAGVALGAVLVRTMRFWTDASNGELWMAGGAPFAIILVGTILLRFGVRFAATGSPYGYTAQNESTSLLSVLSSDLLFLTLGLWLSRAVLILLRHRAHTAQPAGNHPSSSV